MCVVYKSVFDTEKCSFVNTRPVLHTPPSKNQPLIKEELSFSGQKPDWRILQPWFHFCSFIKPSWGYYIIMSMSETGEVSLLIHPTNNCLFSSSFLCLICFWQNLQNPPPFLYCTINQELCLFVKGTWKFWHEQVIEDCVFNTVCRFHF